jgi:3-phenylpropionate/trans-cinnamate dioxygenase ferredoxin reductase subunit
MATITADHTVLLDSSSGHGDDIVTAAMNVNVWDVVDDLEALIESRAAVDAARPADPDVPLGEVVR